MTRLPYLIFGCMAFFMIAGCGEPSTEEAQTNVRPAKLLTVGAASQERDLVLPAVVRATQSAELTFPVAGEVRELEVLESQNVARGDVIASLDPTNARNALAQAQAELDNATSEFNRARRLREQDAISQSALETRETQLEVTQAAVNNARKALADTVIRAPFDGVISRVYVEQFQNVQAKEAIAVIQSGDTEVIVNVPGTIIARAKQLQPVGTTVILDAAPNVPIPAVFREIAGQADPSTQTYQTSFTFEAPENLVILPGMTATLRSTFLIDGVPDIALAGVAVPIDAIVSEGELRYVWIVNEAMQLERREVQVAPDVSDQVTVTSGLAAGETIVSAGGSFMAEGMTVRAWSPE